MTHKATKLIVKKVLAKYNIAKIKLTYNPESKFSFECTAGDAVSRMRESIYQNHKH